MTPGQHYKLRLLLRQRALERDEVCQKCLQSDDVDTAHIMSVGAHKGLEFELINVIMLCRKDHDWFDNHKIDAMNWFKQKYQFRYEQLMILRMQPKHNLDYEEIKRKIDINNH